MTQHTLIRVIHSVVTTVVYIPNTSGGMDIHTEWVDELTGDFIGDAPKRTLSINAARKYYRSQLLGGYSKL